jgi:D-alanine--D-alanine ligase
MKKANVAVLFGGMSTEHEVSCRSAVFVIRNIDREKYDVRLFGITKKGVWYLYEGNTENIENGSWVKEAEQGPQPLYKTEQFIKELKNIDIVFPVLHGKNGEDGTIQGFLQVLDIPYVAEENMKHRLWKKLMINTGVNQIVTIYEGTFKTVQQPGEARDMMIAAMREVIL